MFGAPRDRWKCLPRTKGRGKFPEEPLSGALSGRGKAADARVLSTGCPWPLAAAAPVSGRPRLDTLGTPQGCPLALAFGIGIGQFLVMPTVLAVEVHRLLVAVSSGGDWDVRRGVIELWRFLG